MTGIPWNAKVLQLLARFLKKWISLILTAGLFVVLLTSALSAVCISQGICRQSTLKKSDIKELSSQSSQSTSSNIDNKKEIVIITKPIRMLLPSIDLGVDIIDATINIATNEWPLSDTTAQYANFTPGLGSEKGTMLIYGHNSWPVMRRTGDLKIGDELILIDENNHTWRFILIKEENVVPENVGFIYEDISFRVVMFTCNGWNDQYRRLMYFAPVD